MKHRGFARQSGFTLVEIAIVLVIIGLLLGGVLKGQELINSAKVKSLTNEMKAVQTAYYAYQDKFRAIPGDDGLATTHLGATVNGVTIVNPTGGNTSNGSINTGNWLGLTTAPVAANESALFWQHVRAAGLLSGNADVGTATNAVSGRLGITNITQFTTLAGKVICTSGVDGKQAIQMDTTMDDGVGNTGSVQVKANNNTASAVAVILPLEGTLYTVCMSF